MEGYLQDAEAEMKALEAKFAPDVRKDLERLRKHIVPFVENELIIRYYHQKGVLQHTMPQDNVYRVAVELLNNKQLYKSILEKK
jgi:carboxyl-terminal processing protease